MKKMAALVLAIAAGLTLTSCFPKIVRAAFDLTTGSIPDTQYLGWGNSSVKVYGSGNSGYLRFQTNNTDRAAFTSTGLFGVGTNSPVSSLDVNGGVSVGTYAGVTAAPSNGMVVSGSVGFGTGSPGAAGLNIAAANASSTGTVVNSAASPTADIAEFQVNGATVARVGPQGHIGYRRYTVGQVDTLVPDFLGAVIAVSNMTSSTFFPGGFALCIATGTLADQFSVVGGTHGANQNGCGTSQ